MSEPHYVTMGECDGLATSSYSIQIRSSDVRQATERSVGSLRQTGHGANFGVFVSFFFNVCLKVVGAAALVLVVALEETEGAVEASSSPSRQANQPLLALAAMLLAPKLVEELERVNAPFSGLRRFPRPTLRSWRACCQQLAAG